MAINFGLANEYNVFVFGNMSLSNTDAEGRVAVGGNAVRAITASVRTSPRFRRPTPTRPLWSTYLPAPMPAATPSSALPAT